MSEASFEKIFSMAYTPVFRCHSVTHRLVCMEGVYARWCFCVKKNFQKILCFVVVAVFTACGGSGKKANRSLSARPAEGDDASLFAPLRPHRRRPPPARRSRRLTSQHDTEVIWSPEWEVT